MDSNEWTEWQGAQVGRTCPVDGRAIVQAKMRSGTITNPMAAANFIWYDRRCVSDIVAYRVLSVEEVSTLREHTKIRMRLPAPQTQDPQTRTFRDACAIAAMQGMLSSPELMQVITASDIVDGTASEKIAHAAYRQADAMVKVKEA